MSKWKKIGSVHSGDDKSNRSVRSRSRDQMPTQAFHQNIAKLKIRDADLVDSENTYFCQNYMDRKKSPMSHRSASRVKTQKSVVSREEPFNNRISIITKRMGSKQFDNLSHQSSGDRLQQPKKFKKLPKQNQLKQIKSDHERLKNYVKSQINSFKASLADLSEQLRFQISYKRQMQNNKDNVNNPSMTPIVPFKFNSQILDNMGAVTSGNRKPARKKSQSETIDILAQIKIQTKICVDTMEEIQNQKLNILSQYPDINLQELLS